MYCSLDRTSTPTTPIGPSMPENLSYGASPPRALFDPVARVSVKVTGAGHSIGSKTISSEVIDDRLQLEPNSTHRRTGISSTRQCGPGEDMQSLALDALNGACDAALVDPSKCGHETVLLYVTGGIGRYATPPSGNELAQLAGMDSPRVYTLDLACGAAIGMIELAAAYLYLGLCDRVILVAASDLDPFVSADDEQAAGLFGAAAAAIVLERGSDSAGIVALYWKTLPEHALIGHIKVESFRWSDSKPQVTLEPFWMDGMRIARLLWDLVPDVSKRVIDQAGWAEPDLWLCHQPAPRLLDAIANRLSIPPEKLMVPARTIGNTGPASAFVALSMAINEGRMPPGTRALILAFGFGLSCGAVAIEI